MSLLRRLFGKNQEDKTTELLDRCVKCLRVGLFTRILVQCKNEYKDNKPALIAGTIMNYITCDEPTTDEGKFLLQNNKTFIEQKTCNLIQNKPEIKDAVAMLYLASMSLLIQSGGHISEHVVSLSSRATDIGVQIPSPDDFGGINNMLKNIADFAEKYNMETDKLSLSVYNK